jgi:hypothetical protein
VVGDAEAEVGEARDAGTTAGGEAFLGAASVRRSGATADTEAVLGGAAELKVDGMQVDEEGAATGAAGVPENVAAGNDAEDADESEEEGGEGDNTAQARVCEDEAAAVGFGAFPVLADARSAVVENPGAAGVGIHRSEHQEVASATP